MQASAAASTFAAAFDNLATCVAALKSPPSSPPPASKSPAPPAPPRPSPPAPGASQDLSFAFDCIGVVAERCCRAGAPLMCVCAPIPGGFCSYMRASTNPLSYAPNFNRQPLVQSACRCPA